MGSHAFQKSPWGKLELHLMRLKVCFLKTEWTATHLCSSLCLLTELLWIFWSNNQSNNKNDLWLWAMIISRKLWSIRHRNIRSAMFGMCKHRSLTRKLLLLCVSVKKLWRSSCSLVMLLGNPLPFPSWFLYQGFLPIDLRRKSQWLF